MDRVELKSVLKLFPFHEDDCREYVAIYGKGEPTDEGMALARQMHAQGELYAAIAHEVVYRGLTNEK